MRKVYSYVNNATATEQQAIKMLEDDLGYKLKVIPKSQLNNYTSKYQTAVWVLCMSDSCKRMIYITPRSRKPHYSDYQKLLASAKRRGMKILPKIKVDLDNFPSYKHAVVQENYYIEFEVTLKSNIILQSKRSKNPITYTPGSLISLKYSESSKISNYLKAWSKMKLISYGKGDLKLQLGNSITNEFYDLDVSVSGNSFSGTITPTPTKSLLNDQWIIEGQISLSITGTIYPYKPGHHIASSSVESLHKVNYTCYILLGIGVAAINLATFGVGDAIVLPAIGAGTIAASN